MKIQAINSMLRFNESEGWTEDKIRSYLVCPTLKINYRADLKYFAISEGKGHKAFNQELLTENQFDNTLNTDINWYIKFRTVR